MSRTLKKAPDVEMTSATLMQPDMQDPVGGQEAPQAQQPVSLKGLAVRGALWTSVGYGLSQVVRLGANLLLARLLLPESFGLMAIVNVYLQGLQMFCDLGVGTAIIQNKRGDDPEFLNTAWSIQVVRGVLLWLITAMLAAPVALLYGEPRLTLLLPAAGVTALIAGFNSTALYTLSRRVALRKVVTLDLIGQSAGVAVMVLWAVFSPTVWALVAGGVATSLARLVLSTRLIDGHRNHLRWDRPAVRTLIHFGKWLTISSILGFLATQGDRAILGGVLSMSDLGVYSFAFFWSRFAIEAVRTLARRVLLPVYTKLSKGPPDQLRTKVNRVRISLLAFTLPPLWLMTIFGPELIHLLYPAQYHDAGWMLQILAGGGVVMCIVVTVQPIILASGDSFRFMLILAARAACLLGGMAIGGWLYGLPGIIAGVALAPTLSYPVLAWAVHRRGVWSPGLDAAAVAISAAVIGTGLWLTNSM